MSKPRLLDLFCGAGGAAVGYSRAGFEVVGVDIEPQPDYPFEFCQADALAMLRTMMQDGGEDGHAVWLSLGGFDAVHASPPCQGYTRAHKLRRNEHPDLIVLVRELLEQSGLPYVIENVPGAPLIGPIELCGTMFGLPLYRHRLFECSFPVDPPLHGQHWLRQVKMGRTPGDDEIVQVVGNFSGADRGREAMGVDWMTRDELKEAIPPAFTEFLGTQLLLQHITTHTKGSLTG